MSLTTAIAVQARPEGSSPQRRGRVVFASSRTATAVAGRRYLSVRLGEAEAPAAGEASWRPRRKVVGFRPGSVIVISNEQSRSALVDEAATANGSIRTT